MRERDVERRLVELVKLAGGRAMKFISPGFTGVPDRLVVLPGRRVFFVEVKAPGKAPTALQRRVHAWLRQFADVWVVASYEDVEAVLRVYEEGEG